MIRAECIEVLILAPFLTYAALQDVRSREISIFTWGPVLATGVFSGAVSILVSPLHILPRTVVFTALTVVFSALGLLKAGDTVLLLGIGLSHVPLERPLISGMFLNIFSPGFGLTVLLNTELLSLTLIPAKIVNGLKKGGWRKALSRIILSVRKHSAHKHDYSHAEIHGNPLVPFMLPGYLFTLLFGSILPV
ncbi:MAG: hypothetical protein ACUVQ0_05895 [Thermoproteota archaeon]